MPHAVPHSPTRVTYAIGKVEVPCVDKYVDGQTINAAEAAALNQLRRENVRNVLFPRWKREDEKGLPKHVGFASRLEEAIAYQEAYEFGGRKSGRPASATHDPVRAEAFVILVKMIKNQMAAKGLPIKGKTEVIHARANALLDGVDQLPPAAQEMIQLVFASARENVEKLKAAGAELLEGLGQDAPEASDSSGDETQAEAA